MVRVPEEEPFNLPTAEWFNFSSSRRRCRFLLGPLKGGLSCGWGVIVGPYRSLWCGGFGASPPPLPADDGWLVLLVVVSVVGLLGNWSFLRSPGPQELLSRPFGNTSKRFGRERKPWQWWCDGNTTYTGKIIQIFPRKILNKECTFDFEKCHLERNLSVSRAKTQRRQGK